MISKLKHSLKFMRNYQAKYLALELLVPVDFITLFILSPSWFIPPKKKFGRKNSVVLYANNRFFSASNFVISFSELIFLFFEWHIARTLNFMHANFYAKRESANFSMTIAIIKLEQNVFTFFMCFGFKKWMIEKQGNAACICL